MFITSKLWNTYHHKEHVEPACRRSLQDLGVDYLDLYLVHFPISLKYVPMETRYPPEWEYEVLLIYIYMYMYTYVYICVCVCV